MSEPADNSLPTKPPAARGVRPKAPVARPSAPTMAAPGKLMPTRPSITAPSDALSELAAIAGSTIAPSTVAPPSASAISTLRASMPTISAAASSRQAASNRAILVPPCLTLGVTLPILGIAWFTLERHRVLRDNPLGLALPILLFAGGAIFLGLLAVMLLGSQGGGRRSTTIETLTDKSET